METVKNFKEFSNNNQSNKLLIDLYDAVDGSDSPILSQG